MIRQATNSRRHRREMGFVENTFRAAGQIGIGAFNAVRVVCLNSALDVDRLQSVLAHVQQKHELLRSTIDHGDRSFVLLPKVRVPLEHIESPEPEHWESLATELLHVRFQDGGLLWRCVLRQPSVAPTNTTRESNTGSQLVLVFHHAISDGLAVTQFVSDVLEIYRNSDSLNSTERDQQISRPPAFSYPGNAKLLKKSWLRVATFCVDQAQNFFRFHSVNETLGLPHQELHRRRTRLIFGTMEVDQTTRLISQCKAFETSVTSVLTAAMLAAVASTTSRKKFCAKSFTNIDLRRPLGINDSEFGCYIYWTSDQFKINPAKHFVTLARQYATVSDRSRRRYGRPPTNLLRWSAEQAIDRIANGNASGRTNEVGVSNLGRMNVNHPVDGVRVEHMFSATGQHVMGSAAQMICGTLDGKFHYTLMMSSQFSTSQIDNFDKALNDILDRFGATGDFRIGELVEV